MKIFWCDEAVFQLIEEVGKVEYIWNIRNPYYKNRLKKQHFWLWLAEELNNRFHPREPFTYDHIIQKWNNLKSYYTCQMQRLFKAQKNGAGVEEIDNITNSWKFQSKLDFLMSNMERTLSANNFNKQSLQNLQNWEPNFAEEYIKEEYSQNTEDNEIDFYNESALTETDPLMKNLTPSSRPETSRECLFQSQAFDQSSSRTTTNTEFDHRVPTSAKLKQSYLGSPVFERPSSRNLRAFTSLKSTQKKSIESLPSSPAATSPCSISTSGSGNISRSSLSHPQRVKRKARSLHPSTDEITAKLIRSSENISQALYDLRTEPKKHSNNSSFGVYIADSLDKLDGELQRIGKKKIFDVLMELEEQQFKKNDCWPTFKRPTLSPNSEHISLKSTLEDEEEETDH